MDKDSFYVEEYKALREEITTALKTRLDFNSWGLLGIGALYSYIFSNLDKPLVFPWLLWVPFGLCVSMVWHLLDQHRMVAKAGEYIGDQIEAWITTGKIKGGKQGEKPQGWETFLQGSRDQKGLQTWKWTPVPLWCCLTALTGLIAFGFLIAWGSGWRPPKPETAAENSSTAPASNRDQRLDTRLRAQDAAMTARIDAAIDSLEQKLDARLTTEDAALNVKIDAAQSRTDTKLRTLTELVNPTAIAEVLKALLSTEGGHGASGPISISIDSDNGPTAAMCNGTAQHCCKAEHGRASIWPPHAKSGHGPMHCR